MSASKPVVVLSKADYVDLAERVAALRMRFEACNGSLPKKGLSPDLVANALSTHLANITAAMLPAAAATIWHEKIARPLKADTQKPLPSRAISGLCSWPSARIGALVDALTEIEAILVDTENDARNEIIYAEISRAYS